MVRPASSSQQLLDTGPGRPKALLALFFRVKLLMVSITYDFKFFSILPNCLILYIFLMILVKIFIWSSELGLSSNFSVYTAVVTLWSQ